MPNNAEHCEDSLRRYGKTFSELHKWMDEPSAILGASHRKYRHDPKTTHREAKAIFGENADNACLDHIRLDALESRQKGSSNTSATANYPSIYSIILPLIFVTCTVMFFIIGYFTVEGIGVSITCYLIAFVSFIGFIWSISLKRSSEVELQEARVRLQKSKDELKKVASDYEARYGADYEISPFDTPEVKTAKERLKKAKAEFEAYYGPLPEIYVVRFLSDYASIECYFVGMYIYNLLWNKRALDEQPIE